MSEKKKIWFTLEVTPCSAGDSGYARISSIRYTERELETLAAEMQREIERHVSRVGDVTVSWEYEDQE